MLHDALFTCAVDVAQSRVCLELSPEFPGETYEEVLALTLAGSDGWSFSVELCMSETADLVTRVTITWHAGRSVDRASPAPEAWSAAVSLNDEQAIGTAFDLRVVSEPEADGFAIAWGSVTGESSPVEISAPERLLAITEKLTSRGILFGQNTGAVPSLAVEMAAGRQHGVFGVLARPAVAEALRDKGIQAADVKAATTPAAVDKLIDQLLSIEMEQHSPITWYTRRLASMLELEFYEI